MQRFRNWMLLFVLAAVSTSSVIAAEGDRRRANDWGKRFQTERLAAELYRQSNAICWEMIRYYKHNDKYNENYREMYEIREAAKRIHDMVTDGYHRRRFSREDRIEAELKVMDNLFHHIDWDVRRWRSSRRDSSRGADLIAQMDEVERTLHRLMDDYGVDSKFHKGYPRWEGRDRDRDRDRDGRIGRGLRD